MFLPHLPIMVALLGLSTACDWEFMQKTGDGIKLGAAYRSKNGSAWLHVKCNVCQNSSTVVRAVRIRVKQGKIHLLVIVSSFPHGRFKSCHYDSDVKLGRIKSGNYEVVYDSKKDLYPLIDTISVPD